MMHRPRYSIMAFQSWKDASWNCMPRLVIPVHLVFFRDAAKLTGDIKRCHALINYAQSLGIVHTVPRIGRGSNGEQRGGTRAEILPVDKSNLAYEQSGRFVHPWQAGRKRRSCQVRPGNCPHFKISPRDLHVLRGPVQQRATDDDVFCTSRARIVAATVFWSGVIRGSLVPSDQRRTIAVFKK